ncbi:hypothetical protein HXX76_008185 [Chlamydomonas incerta]|uniref:Uncharacterized protein n=1 Tax=Chlamydomonas incerta TaxID=51695 RepID=A0A835W1J2_CHLIN|nr:hypothetical protein HXX76_008185 [Chlamydomonas incerta]|eukprot:KAG2433828.1 hypothetical protein HXX76_008185 [Chlamydomonas incerta]
MQHLGLARSGLRAPRQLGLSAAAPLLCTPRRGLRLPSAAAGSGATPLRPGAASAGSGLGLSEDNEPLMRLDKAELVRRLKERQAQLDAVAAGAQKLARKQWAIFGTLCFWMVIWAATAVALVLQPRAVGLLWFIAYWQSAKQLDELMKECLPSFWQPPDEWLTDRLKQKSTRVA